MSKNVLVTTSIAYVNGTPHLGFAMESIQADCYSRWRRNKGDTVFFATGTDEHGSKIYRAAQEQKMSEQELTDVNAERFLELGKVLHISHDDFIRTTQSRHKKGAQEVWKRIAQNGDFSPREFQGLYCVGCEAFLTEKELVNGECPHHLKKPEEITEENIFFHLSEYSEKILHLFDSGDLRIIPDFRKNEIVQLITEGLKDVSFSRPRKTLPWGVEVPGHSDQTMYVWCDALNNYLTVVGFGENENWKKYWEDGEVVHFIGKDILRFHAGIWPAMLLSANIPVPSKICVHGFLTSEGHKMSKSLGNIVDPFEVVKSFGGNPDPLRYFLLSEVPFGRDADYSKQRFLEIYNAKLANGFGNLFSRVLTLAKKSGGSFPSSELKNTSLQKLLKDLPSRIEECMQECTFHLALGAIFEVVEFLNLDIDRVKPWVMMKEEKGSAREYVSDWICALTSIAQEIEPFLPYTSGLMQEALKTGDSIILFPRKEKGKE